MGGNLVSRAPPHQATNERAPEKIRTMTVGVILTALLRYLNYITDYWDLGIG